MFGFIIESVAQKMGSWKNQFLSSAGKEVLIKAVISVMPVYAMSCLKLPGNVCGEIEKMTAKLWWSNGECDKKIHWKSWTFVTQDKNDGGLGFRFLQDFNLAFMAKQLWRLIVHPNLLVSKVIKSKYFPSNGLFSAEANSQASWLWKSWIGAKHVLENGVRFQVGDGKLIRI